MTDQTFAPLLSVRDLAIDYRGARRAAFRAVTSASFDIGTGECLGLVGESGSGKSTIGKAILGMVPVAEGTIAFEGEDITGASRRRRRELASRIQVVFQDPYGSLDPGMTIGRILAEPLAATGVGRREAAATVAEMIDRVRLPKSMLERYPSEFSGGQRQRIAIARALVRRPRLVVCDEPVSALDLTTQAAILDLFIELQRDTDVSYLFVSHDLGVVRRVCHRVAVLYDGRIVETGEGGAVTSEPEHPYSKRLLTASPVADPAAQAQRRKAWLALKAKANGAAS